MSDGLPVTNPGAGRTARPPAVALTTDSSFLTAHANDFDFEHAFARQVGLRSVALTGIGGGRVAPVAGVICELVEQELCSA